MISGRTEIVAHLGYPTESFTARMILRRPDGSLHGDIFDGVGFTRRGARASTLPARNLCRGLPAKPSADEPFGF